MRPNSNVNGVWGRGPDDVYAVGEDHIFHYNGNWGEELHVPVPAKNLHAVWGSNTSDVFAVGELLVVEGEAPGVVLHRTASTGWSDPSNTIHGLRGVWLRGSDDVFAVGNLGSIVHWNGIFWSPTRIDAAQHITLLKDIWGTGMDDIFAVGRAGTIVHHGAESWHPIARTSHLPEDSWAMWARGPDDVHVVGRGMSRISDGAWHLFMDVVDDDVTLYGIWGSESTGEAIAVGWGSGSKIYRFDGNAFLPVKKVQRNRSVTR